MSTLELKSHLHQLIDNIQDNVALEDIQQFINLYLTNNQEDNWNRLSDTEKESIERGLAQLENNEKINYAEIREKYKKWLTK